MKIFQLLISLNAFVDALGEAEYYKDLIKADLDNFLVLWEDKRFKRRLLGPSHPKAGNPRKGYTVFLRLFILEHAFYLKNKTRSENARSYSSSKTSNGTFFSARNVSKSVASRFVKSYDKLVFNFGLPSLRCCRQYKNWNRHLAPQLRLSR